MLSLDSFLDAVRPGVFAHGSEGHALIQLARGPLYGTRSTSSTVRKGFYFADEGLPHQAFIRDTPSLRVGGFLAAARLLHKVKAHHKELTIDIPLAELGTEALASFLLGLRGLIRIARADGDDRAYLFQKVRFFANSTDDIFREWDDTRGPSCSVLSLVKETFFDHAALFSNLSHFSCDAHWSDACGSDLLKIAGDPRTSTLILMYSATSPNLFLELLRTVLARVEEHPGSLEYLELPHPGPDLTDEWLEEVRELLLRLIGSGRDGLVMFGWSCGHFWMQEEDWAVVETNRWLTSLTLVTWNVGSSSDWKQAVKDFDDRVEPILSRNRLREVHIHETARTLFPAARVILATAGCSTRSAAAEVPWEIRLHIVGYLADGLADCHLSKRQFKTITDYAGERETLDRARLEGYKRSFLSEMDCSRWQGEDEDEDEDEVD